MTDDRITVSAEVIDAINGELAYVTTLQEQGRADAEDYGIEGQLLNLNTYTRRANDAWVNNATSEPSRHKI